MKIKINKLFLIFLCIFIVVSILTIYSSLMYTSKDLGNISLKQLFWYTLGLIVLFFITKFKNKFIYEKSWLFYIIGVVLLILLLLFGVPINNSKCWFVVPGIGSFQPSEFMKLFIMFILAKLIFSFRNSKTEHSLFEEFILIIKCSFVVAIPALLTFLQPDTGAVIIYLIIFVSMLFFSGIRLRWFVFAFLIFISCAGLFGSIYFFNEDLFLDLFGTSIYYRIERLLMWKDGIGLQLENAIAAIGSGGWMGHGFNNTPIYFPESSTDFIFAVFASNYGFIGSALFLIVLFIFDLYIFSLIKEENSIDRYVLIGILCMLLFQQIQNIGMTIGLFPITGITLPFISYGGSSLISYMIIMGILMNSSLEKKKYIVKIKDRY